MEVSNSDRGRRGVGHFYPQLFSNFWSLGVLLPRSGANRSAMPALDSGHQVNGRRNQILCELEMVARQRVLIKIYLYLFGQIYHFIYWMSSPALICDELLLSINLKTSLTSSFEITNLIFPSNFSNYPTSMFLSEFKSAILSTSSACKFREFKCNFSIFKLRLAFYIHRPT